MKDTPGNTSDVHFILQGEPARLPPGSSLTDLVNQQQLQGKRFALELNGSIIPHSEFSSTGISSHDLIEIVHAVGGG